MIRRLSSFLLLIALGIGGCQESPPPPANALKLGALVGDHLRLATVLKQLAKKEYALRLSLIPFTNQDNLNLALERGAIGIAFYRNKQTVAAINAVKGYHLRPVASVVILPMAIYSSNISSYQQLHDKATIAIPAEPIQQARALALLDKGGFIKLKHTQQATLNDIAFNPKGFIITSYPSIELASLAKQQTLVILPLVDALSAKLSPGKAALFRETGDSPYALQLAIGDNKNAQPALEILKKIIKDKRFIDQAQRLYQGQLLLP